MQWRNPQNYDLMLNTALGIDTCVRIICEAAGEAVGRRTFSLLTKMQAMKSEGTVQFSRARRAHRIKGLPRLSAADLFR